MQSEHWRVRRTERFIKRTAHGEPIKVTVTWQYDNEENHGVLRSLACNVEGDPERGAATKKIINEFYRADYSSDSEN